MTWRDGDALDARILGSGSISCLGLTAEEGAAAERRRGPLGFRLAPHIEEWIAEGSVCYPYFLEEAVAASASARAERIEKLVETALAEAGEAAWTARDTFVVREYPDGRVEVV